MNVSERRQIAQLKERLQRNDCAGALRILQPLLPRKASEKSKATRARKSARKAAKSEKHRMTTAEIRSAVRDRAGFRCEACGGIAGSWLVMDHWEGGSGRRRQRQSVETCWALCTIPHGGCNKDRTDNHPSAAYWNEARQRHCAKYGYEFKPHVEHAPLERRRPPSSPSVVHDPVRRPNVG